MESSSGQPGHSTTNAQNANSPGPSIYIEDANPDVFHDVPVRCLVMGATPGDYFVSVTVSQGPLGSSPKPCGWNNILLTRGENSYIQTIFDRFENIQVGPDGIADFGLKFLSLSKDGLLPQFPIRVCLCRDKEAKEVVAATPAFRVISYKMRIRQISEGRAGTFPKFEMFLSDVFGKTIEIAGKVELALYSTTCSPDTRAADVEWQREPVSWGYDRGQKSSEVAILPAIFSIKATAALAEKNIFRLRASLLTLSSNSLSLTKIGRGYSLAFQGKAFSVPPKSLPPAKPSSVVVTAPSAVVYRPSFQLPEVPPPPPVVVDSNIPKTPQDTVRQFAQAVMKALHTAYISAVEDDINTEQLKDAHDLYQKLDITACLDQLHNPAFPREPTPPPFEKVTVSLKHFLIPGPEEAKSLSSVAALSASRAHLTPTMASSYQQGESATSGVYLQGPAPESQHNEGALVSSGRYPYQVEATENLVAYVNRLYVSLSGRFLGFPAHRGGDLKLLGFYEETADGLHVAFSPKVAVPIGVQEFLELFCAREYEKEGSFFRLSNDGIAGLKYEIAASLSHKQFYHFP